MYKCKRCGRELTAENAVIGWTYSVYCKHCKIPVIDIEDIKGDYPELEKMQKIDLDKMRESGYLI